MGGMIGCITGIIFGRLSSFLPRLFNRAAVCRMLARSVSSFSGGGAGAGTGTGTGTGAGGGKGAGRIAGGGRGGEGGAGNSIGC